ncbi:hypothetical protein [Camelimonas lactis]|uniref:Uncharacterized protein n=1 Tax=Camelimonas lactis TaxID=659006 RepID=A0A4R2GRE2_9HYPH|nr:hypothetical protein [Camelimonas lactis]TCO12357.1 hypothetical protein EV666_1092 [Camelimonas lactis]
MHATVQTVAAATDTARPAINAWLDRRIIELRAGDRPAAHNGDPIRLSRNRAVQIAVAAELTRLGLPARAAARAAYAASDLAGGVNLDGQPMERQPGHLFPSGSTWLVATADSARVVNGPVDASFASIARAAGDGRVPRGCVVVELAPLVAQADMALVAG